jgi:AraC-like DNA-binding protein
MRKTLINSESKVFPASYLLLLLNVIETHGFEITDLLNKVELPPLTMHDPEQFVSLAYLKQFLERILAITQIPELGLYFGQQLNFVAHGDIGNAIITSKNLHESIQVILKYFKTRTPLADINFASHDHHCVIIAGFNLLPNVISDFLVDAFFATLLTVRKFILSNTHYDVEIHFTKPQPKDIKPYTDLFGPNVTFSSSRNEYHFPKESLTLTFPLSNTIAREIAERKCQQKLLELEHLDDLVSKIKSFMLSTPSYFPSIEELSQQLHMSTRTLRRKLKDVDSSYQTILDDLRKELAINYLQNSQLSILEIAYMLQFSDSSNFSSAFRKWTNKSPSDYRLML